MRLSVVAACLSVCLIGFSSANDAHASIRKETNIPAEGLGPALNALAKDRNFQIVYVTEEIANVRTEGAVGEFTTDEALKRLLTGTGLTFRYLDDKTVTIGPAATPLGRSGRAKATSSESSDDSNANQEGEEKSSSRDFRVAQLDQGAATGASPVAIKSTSTRSEIGVLQEVVVTAQKKEERLQDVPAPVAVINTQELSSTDQVRLQDYYAQVPGLNFSPSEYGAPQLAVRGLTTGGFTNPTVGITIDDVPYGSPSALAEGNQAPDLDPSDLARIEVLRGPQGTLYGASSLGGLVKYVTSDPSTSDLFGTLQAGTSGVQNGAQAGYSARGSINVPINDTLAIRASAFSRLDPGYIDNVVSGRDGVNKTTAEGGLFSALWRPSDVFSLKLMALVQHSDAEGASYATVGLGDLEQSAVPGTGGSTRDSQVYSATMKFNLGAMELTSVSGYNINKFTQSLDYTWGLGSYTEKEFGVAGSVYVTHVDTGNFTQELRLTGKISDSFEWLVGGFFDHSSTQLAEPLYAENELTGAIVGTWTTINTPNSYSEYAGFADLTYHVTQSFDIQFGARESQNRQSLSESFVGEPYARVFFLAPSPIVYPKVTSTGNSFTYLVTPELRITPDLMVYARVASGYRPGGPNYNASAGAPAQYAADTTKNYELGLKGDFLEHALTVDGSVYYIDWSNMQLQLNNPKNGLDYFANGSKAKSEGVAARAQRQANAGLTLGLWAAYDDAVLTEPLPATSTVEGPTGARLPYGSRISGNATINEEFPLDRGWTGFVGAALSYVGEREGEFTATPDRQIFPAYTTTNLKFGARDDLWNVTLYGNNIADKRGVVGGGVGSFIPYGLFYIQPRTIGVVVSRKF